MRLQQFSTVKCCSAIIQNQPSLSTNPPNQSANTAEAFVTSALEFWISPLVCRTSKNAKAWGMQQAREAWWTQVLLSLPVSLVIAEPVSAVSSVEAPSNPLLQVSWAPTWTQSAERWPKRPTMGIKLACRIVTQAQRKREKIDLWIRMIWHSQMTIVQFILSKVVTWIFLNFTLFRTSQRRPSWIRLVSIWQECQLCNSTASDSRLMRLRITTSTPRKLDREASRNSQM